MLSAKILNKSLTDLHEITHTRLALVNRNGEVIVNHLSADPTFASTAAKFWESNADTMESDGTIYIKITDSGKTEFVLVLSGDNCELTGRLAVSSLTNLLAVSHERTDKNRFMHNVLLDNILPVEMRDEARKLKIKEETPRTVFLIESTESDNELALQTLRALYTALGNNAFVTSLDSTHIAVVTESPENMRPGMIDKTAYTIADSLNMDAMIKVRVSYGETAVQLAHLSQSYKEAQLAMEVGRIFYPDRHVVSYGNLGIGRLIYQLPTSLCEIFLKETFDHDVFAELDDETMLTIRHFFDNNLNISETARQLYIHRNTLVYRIEKLEKTTGLDIRKFDEAMTFKIAMMVYDYLKSR